MDNNDIIDVTTESTIQSDKGIPSKICKVFGENEDEKEDRSDIVNDVKEALEDAKPKIEESLDYTKRDIRNAGELDEFVRYLRYYKDKLKSKQRDGVEETPEDAKVKSLIESMETIKTVDDHVKFVHDAREYVKDKFESKKDIKTVGDLTEFTSDTREYIEALKDGKPTTTESLAESRKDIKTVKDAAKFISDGIDYLEYKLTPKQMDYAIDEAIKESGLEDKVEKASKEEKEEYDASVYTQAIDEMVKLVNEAESGMTHEDAKCMYEIFNRIKEDRGEVKFSVYNKMTPALKEKVKKTAALHGVYNIQGVQSFAKTMAGQMYQDTLLDKEWVKLQGDLKKANRIPEQMDIFGSVLYDRMVLGALVKNYALLDKDPDNYCSINVFTKTAITFLDNWYLLTMMKRIVTDTDIILKQKNIKRICNEIDTNFDIIKIQTSVHTKAQSIYTMIAKKFNDEKARWFIYGVDAVLKDCVLDNNVDNIQNAFVISLIMGILSYINLDEEVQTEQGKLLVDNFNRYCEFCSSIPAETKNILPNTESFKILISAEKDMSELYNKKLEEAKQKYEDDIASNISTTINPSTSDNSEHTVADTNSEEKES